MASENDLRASVAPAPGGDSHAIMRDLADAEDRQEEARQAWALECANRNRK